MKFSFPHSYRYRSRHKGTLAYSNLRESPSRRIRANTTPKTNSLCSFFSNSQSVIYLARMGRRKVEIKKIEDKNSRQVTFSKRRNGLMKKAKELSILCDVDVAALIFSGRGKLYDFCSTNSLAKILQRYHSYMEAGEGPAEISGTAKCNSECRKVLTIKKLLEIVERDLKEPHVDHLNLSYLVHLEEQLEDALTQTRSRKTHLLMESINGLSEMEKMLREENKLLQDEIAGSTPNEQRNDMILEFGDLTQVGMCSGKQQATLKLL